MSDKPTATAEAEAAAVTLPFPTEVKVDYPLAVIPQPQDDPVPAPTDDDDLLMGNPDDTYVPPEVEQRLIYQWLLVGPSWAPSMVMQAPDPPPDEAAPTVVPFRQAMPRRVGDGDDGLNRCIIHRH